MARTFTYTTEVFDEYTDFPQTGDVDTIYIDASKNKAYRYDQSYYPISSEGVDIWGAIGSLSKGGGGGGGGASWGSINGTLSNQTDLNTALSAKQDTLTLTTTGTSGAATLVDSTLNIPQYSGGGGASDFKFKAISSTQGTSVTGINGVAISSSVFIPSGTLTANDNIIDLLWAGRRQSGAGVVQAQLYLNNTNSLTGATLFAIGLNYTSNNWNGKHLRTLFQNGNTLVTNQTPSALSNTDYSTPASPSTYAYNPLTDDLYIIFAMNNLNANNISYTNGYKVLCY